MTTPANDSPATAPAARGPRLGYVFLRVISMAITGTIVAVAVGLSWSWWYAPVSGWSVAAATYVAIVWFAVWRMGPSETRSHATREDPGIVAGEGMVISASVASLAAVAVIMLRARNDHGALQVIVAVLAVVSIVLSWTLIHTLYTLRYAREYYSAPEGGIDFNQAEPPRYSDFAYLAFDLGMTFQVSDTTLRSSRLRQIVLRHTLLSYAFGTFVLASTINLVSGL